MRWAYMLCSSYSLSIIPKYIVCNPQNVWEWRVANILYIINTHRIYMYTKSKQSLSLLKQIKSMTTTMTKKKKKTIIYCVFVCKFGVFN